MPSSHGLDSPDIPNWSPTQPGSASPVDALVNKAIFKLESKEYGGLAQFADAMMKGSFSGKILISTGETKVRPPFANLRSRAIYLPQSYLMHLWAFMYGVFVIEERLQERLAKGEKDFSLEPNDALEARAWELLKWSRTLVKKVTPWPDLPRPGPNSIPEEEGYAKKVNSLFVDAVMFVAMHEYAHLTQGHDTFADTPEADQAFERLELEKEADNFARDVLNRPYGLGEVGLVEALPILLLMSSCLMLIRHPAELQQQNHPDLDDRLLYQLGSFTPRRPHDTDYAQLLCILVFRLFLIQHEAPRTDPFGGFETTTDALENVCQDMTALKSQGVADTATSSN